MMAARSERFEMRLDARLIERLDRWRERQDDEPSRAEAVRRLVERGLEGERRQLVLSDGERLLLGMLADVHAATVKEGEFEPDFVKTAICGGHLWGLEWKYPGLYEGHSDSPATVAEVVAILEMWSYVEWSLAKLPADLQARVEAEAGGNRAGFRFPGFDGNEESEHYSVAAFMIGELERFQQFKDRDLNSHHPMLDRYRRQLRAFEPMRPRLRGEPMRAPDLIEILSER